MTDTDNGDLSLLRSFDTAEVTEAARLMHAADGRILLVVDSSNMCALLDLVEAELRHYQTASPRAEYLSLLQDRLFRAARGEP